MREAAFCLLVAFAALAAAADEDVDAPAVGSRWQYAFRDPQFGAAERTFSIEVIGVSGAMVEERLVVDGGDILQAVIDVSELRFHARRLADDVAFIELAPYSAALARGAKQAPGGYPTGPLPGWAISLPSYRNEQVTVPAGSFATSRVQVRGRSGPIGSLNNTTAMVATHFVYTCWYSAEHRRCIKTRNQAWNQVNQQISDETAELLSYQPGRAARSAPPAK